MKKVPEEFQYSEIIIQTCFTHGWEGLGVCPDCQEKAERYNGKDDRK